MNDIDIFRLTSGLLQFGVAWYVLRLGRLFKSTLTGKLLFAALSIMALLSLALAVQPFDSAAQWGIKVDIVYTLLLLAGVARFYPGLKIFLQEEEAKRQALDKWELQVKEQWVEMIKTNEKLRETVDRQETEIAGRKQAQEQLEKDLQDLRAAPRQNEPALPPAEPTVSPTAQTSPPIEPALPPAVPGLDTEVVAQPLAEIAEPLETNGANGANGEHPEITPVTNGDEPLPVVAGFDTAIIPPEPAPEPVERNGEHPLTASRKNGEGPRPTALAHSRKIAARKPSRPSRLSRSSQASRRKRALAR